MRNFITAPRTIVMFVIVSLVVAVDTLFAQTGSESPIMDVHPYLNLLALSLVIERLIEIAVILIPGIVEKKDELWDKPDELRKFQIKLQRITLGIGMAIGVTFCTLFKFGVLDEIFPGRMSPMNAFNHVVTGLIAGSGSEPVHQLVLMIISVRERLGAASKKS